MAKQQNLLARKQQLAAELDRQRQAITIASQTLKAKVNPLARLRGSVSTKPKLWLIGSTLGATLFGLCTKKLFRRSKPKGGIVQRLVCASLISLAKPRIKSWALSKLASYTKRRRLNK